MLCYVDYTKHTNKMGLNKQKNSYVLAAHLFAEIQINYYSDRSHFYGYLIKTNAVQTFFK